MAKLGINTGTTANDGTGDTLREAGGKINTNFDEVYSTIGDGTNLFTGIVTNITAGNFISISTSFGDVTITGLANTENVNAESLIVSGISTLGMVTSTGTMGIGTIYSPRIEVTGAIIGNTLVGDGSQITGLATTEFVTTDTLVVIGVSTLGVVTNTQSVGANDFYGNFHGDGTNVTNIQYSEVAGLATYSTSAGVATYSHSAGIATYATNAGVATYSTNAGLSTLAVHATTAGVSSYTSTWIVGEDPTNNTHYRFTGPGVSTDQDDPELFLVRGEVYRFTNQMGRHPLQIQTDPNGSIGSASTYTDGITNSADVNGDMIWDVQMDAPKQLYYQCQTHGNMGGSIRILNNNSDLAEYADVAGIATYATSAGVATDATFAGYADSSGISTVSGYADSAGIATYATNAGVATYATNSGVATYAPLAGVSTTSGYADVAGIATYATNAGLSTNATFAGYATNAGLSTNSTFSGYATNAGLSTNSTYAGYATTAGISTVAVNAQGLTGSPSIDVDHIDANDILVVGVTTLGVVTGATYYGDGSNLTGIVLENSVQTFDNLVVSGVTTLGVVTSVQSLSAGDIYATDVVATNVSGDGSGLTNVTATASVGLKLDDVYVGSGFTTIDFRFEGDQSSQFVSVGNTAVFINTNLASTSDTRSNTLVVTGVSTLGVVTNVTSIDVNNGYFNNLAVSNLNGNSDGSDTVLAVTDTTSTTARRVSFINDADPGTSNYETVNVGNLTWTPSSGELAGVITYMGQDVNVTGDVTANSFFGDGSNLTGITAGIGTEDSVNTTGIITASSFVGDGSGITGITAAGTGVNVSDSDSVVGVAATINFGDNLSVSPVSAGVVTVTAAAGSGSTANISADTLVVTGVSTLASVTVTSISGDGSGLTGLGTFSGDYNDLTNQPTIPTNNNQLINGSGFITATGNGSQLVSGLWILGADGTNNYTFTGVGFTQTTNDPYLYLARGRKYQFLNPMNLHPFQIQDTQNGSVGNPYNNGVTNNGSQLGTIEIEVPFNAPDTLYYQCTSHAGMGGTIFIYPTLR